MRYGIGVVGIDGWEKYTEPLLKSIDRFAPTAYTVVVDNGFFYSKDQRSRYPAVNWRTVYGPPIPFAAGLNRILKDFRHNSWLEWGVLLSNDVILNGHLLETLMQLDEDTLYGKNIKRNNDAYWLEGWAFVASMDLFRQVGYFDEHFYSSAFEDADYNFRTRKKGFRTRTFPLPMKHLWSRQRRKSKQFEKWRKENWEYLESKWGPIGNIDDHC